MLKHKQEEEVSPLYQTYMVMVTIIKITLFHLVLLAFGKVSSKFTFHKKEECHKTLTKEDSTNQPVKPITK